jgi:hypothetical protein
MRWMDLRKINALGKFKLVRKKTKTYETDKWL